MVIEIIQNNHLLAAHANYLLLFTKQIKYSLSQQVFEASVQFYVIFVQVAEEFIGAENLCNADQLENNIHAHLIH